MCPLPQVYMPVLFVSGHEKQLVMHHLSEFMREHHEQESLPRLAPLWSSCLTAVHGLLVRKRSPCRSLFANSSSNAVYTVRTPQTRCGLDMVLTCWLIWGIISSRCLRRKPNASIKAVFVPLPPLRPVQTQPSMALEPEPRPIPCQMISKTSWCGKQAETAMLVGASWLHVSHRTAGDGDPAACSLQQYPTYRRAACMSHAAQKFTKRDERRCCKGRQVLVQQPCGPHLNLPRHVDAYLQRRHHRHLPEVGSQDRLEECSHWQTATGTATGAPATQPRGRSQ